MIVKSIQRCRNCICANWELCAGVQILCRIIHMIVWFSPVLISLRHWKVWQYWGETTHSYVPQSGKLESIWKWNWCTFIPKVWNKEMMMMMMMMPMMLPMMMPMMMPIMMMVFHWNWLQSSHQRLYLLFQFQSRNYVCVVFTHLWLTLSVERWIPNIFAPLFFSSSTTHLLLCCTGLSSLQAHQNPLVFPYFSSKTKLLPLQHFSKVFKHSYYFSTNWVLYQQELFLVKYNCFIAIKYDHIYWSFCFILYN